MKRETEKFASLNLAVMDSQATNNDKENVNPVSNVPEVEAPKIYTVESEFYDGNFATFSFY